MGSGGFFAGGIAFGGGDVGGEGGSDVLTHDDGGGNVEGYPTVGCHDEGYGHDG